MINLDPIIENYSNSNVEGNVIKSFSSVKDEYLALKNGVGVKICYLYAKLNLTGAEVIDYINRISTNSVGKIKEFEHVNTLFTNEKGRLIDRTTLIKFPDYNLLVGGYIPDKKLRIWFERYIINEDILVDDITDKMVILELIGKQTESFFNLLLDGTFSSLSNSNVLKYKVEDFEFYLLKFKENESFTKYWMIFDSNDIKAIHDFILDNKSFYDLQFVGEDAYNIFRVENGVPATPNEISFRTNPHELKLLHEVDFHKGCYIGQEVIARLDTYDKVQRYLTGILFEADADFSEITEELNIFNEEKKEIGYITSLVKSEQFGKYAALGFVKKDYAEVGNKYNVIINNKVVTKAVITEIPIKYENIYKNRG